MRQDDAAISSWRFYYGPYLMVDRVPNPLDKKPDIVIWAADVPSQGGVGSYSRRIGWRQKYLLTPHQN